MEMALEWYSEPRGGEKQVAPDTNLLLQILRDLKLPQAKQQFNKSEVYVLFKGKWFIQLPDQKYVDMRKLHLYVIVEHIIPEP